MFEKMKKAIVKNIVKILLLFSLIIYIVSFICGVISDVPKHNSKESTIIINAFFIPFMSGLWIYSNRIRDERRRLSIFIKCVIIYFFCIFMVLTALVFLGVLVP